MINRVQGNQRGTQFNSSCVQTSLFSQKCLTPSFSIKKKTKQKSSKLQSPVDLYQLCLDLQYQISNNGIKSVRCKGVPIAIQLCPLQILFQSTGVSKLFPAYRDVDVNFVNRCVHLLADLSLSVVQHQEILSL